MSYLTKEMAVCATANMVNFHEDVKLVFSKHGMDLLENLGRRNCILSQSQEKFLADEIKKHYDNVECDGRPGQPDIVIRSIDKEVECKLTTRNRSGQINFQTDYETLRSKGSLDYVYIVASPEFDAFAVLHFEKLTIEDFRPPANGSRGRSQMIKSNAMKKCNVLMGQVVNNTSFYLERLDHDLSLLESSFKDRLIEIESRIGKCSPAAIKEIQKLDRMIAREKQRKTNKEKSIKSRIDYWKSSPGNFSIVLSEISKEKSKVGA